ncbi:MAG: tRNA (N6-isopentenyl adenosine(37)-C2)-methylthiotransferase MiaB, partial [Deltaproteobacteria bacterium]|nr:tRNA (N6-isopentenyl adenosine(37)-C2)-methylthiotransferase MiaB [Deltaproteobacteria bacterium]
MNNAAGRIFYMQTFGCKVNQYETEALREAWIKGGGVETDDPAAADVILINSCA